MGKGLRMAATVAGCISLLAMCAAPSALQAAESGRSAYHVVHGWPQLPEGFTFGQVSGVGVDSHNHVFVFHRGGRSPIMCFDGDSGKLLAAWGDGMFGSPHGLSIDDKDN